MRGGSALLSPPHMKPRRGEVDLAPLQVDQFGSPQAVAEGHQDHGGVPMALAVALDRCHQLLDLGRSEVFAGPQIGIFAPKRRNCPIYGGWRHELEMRFCHANCPLIHSYCRINDHFSDSMQSKLSRPARSPVSAQPEKPATALASRSTAALTARDGI